MRACASPSVSSMVFGIEFRAAAMDNSATASTRCLSPKSLRFLSSHLNAVAACVAVLCAQALARETAFCTCRLLIFVRPFLRIKSSKARNDFERIAGTLPSRKETGEGPNESRPDSAIRAPFSVKGLSALSKPSKADIWASAKTWVGSGVGQCCRVISVAHTSGDKPLGGGHGGGGTVILAPATSPIKVRIEI